MRRVSSRALRPAFTLVELLVVIAIIGVLIGIIIPVANSVRTRARVAETQSWLSQLGNAIDRYYQDFKAYPGPLSNDQIRDTSVWTSPDFNAAFPGGIDTNIPAGFKPWTSGASDNTKFTMPENLVLGLLGGLKLDTSGSLALVYDPSIVGTGPRSLNPGNQKKYAPYIEVKEGDLSWQTWSGEKTGEFYDEASVGTGGNPDGADDSIVPEFLDKFPDGMPILYMRPRGAAKNPPDAVPTAVNNGIVTDANTAPGSGQRRNNQYDLDQIIAYTENPPGGSPPIGVSKKAVTYVQNGVQQTTPQPLTHGLRTVTPSAVAGPRTDSNFNYPYDAFPYLRNPQLSGSQTSNTATQVPRQKDTYILISAGADRIYGTDDDITNFGSVGN